MTKAKALLGFGLAIALAAPVGIAQVKKLRPLKPKADAGASTGNEQPPAETAKRLEALQKKLQDLAREQERIQREIDRIRGDRADDTHRGTPPLVSPGPQSGPWPWGRPFDFDGRFRGLEDHLKGLDDQFRDFEKLFRERWAMPGAGVHGSGTSVSVRQTDKGVRVEIKTQDPKGDESTEVYEAKDAEEFARKYPEVVKKYGIRFGDDGTFRFQFGPGVDARQLFRGFPRLAPDSFRPLPPRGDRLGVLVAPLDKERAEELGLDRTRGLVVHEVQPDTLAERLGLEAKDVLLTIDGQAIRDVPDVKRALGGLGAAANVKVEVFRPGTGKIVLEARKTPQKTKIL